MKLNRDKWKLLPYPTAMIHVGGICFYICRLLKLQKSTHTPASLLFLSFSQAIFFPFWISSPRGPIYFSNVAVSKQITSLICFSQPTRTPLFFFLSNKNTTWPCNSMRISLDPFIILKFVYQEQGQECIIGKSLRYSIKNISFRTFKLQISHC